MSHDSDDVAVVAERALLCATIWGGAKTVAEIRGLIDGPSFRQLHHEVLWRSLVDLADSGAPVGPASVLAKLHDAGELRGQLTGDYLARIVAFGTPHYEASYYAGTIRAEAKRRRVRELATRLSQAADESEASDLDEVTLRVLGELEDFSLQALADEPHARTLSEFLAGDDDEYDWLVPGLLERRDRLIVCGPEGGGKSTFLRQIAVQLSRGIHPFGGKAFPPMRVLLLDVENSERQIRRKLRPLDLAARQAAPGVAGDLLYIEPRTQGLDLLVAEDVTWLRRKVDEVRPDMILGGPLYKMVGGDPNEEAPARAFTKVIDKLRSDHDLAIVLETHSPHANGSSKRPKRPIGTSLWLRWPEFGLDLSKEGEISHWRGPRDEREWPALLQRGGPWPWTSVTRERDILWARIKGMCTDAGEQLSQRDLGEQFGVSAATVNRVIAEHRDEWDRLAKGGTS